MLSASAALFLALAVFAGQEAPEEVRARAIVRDLCASPRLAGTSGSLVGARTAARYLEAAGWQVELDAREVLLSYPRRVELAIFADAAAEAPLAERAERFDPDALPPGDVPLYNAWSASGRVRAPVVEVGHGLRADYELLAQAGVDVRGAIALARYGRSYRGVKLELAEEHGCAALLLYHEDDGGSGGERWPAGPGRPGREAERGSVSPVARAPGDPSTPGWPSPAPGEPGTRDARRLDLAAAGERLPRIPCLPIGADEAALLSAELSEVCAPGPPEVELDLDVSRELRTIYNVIARLPGRGPGLVLAGSHRDSWVRGANDSASGTAALIRAAEHLGARARSGWMPEHTLVIGLWDAEEFGLIGSTEWGEAHADELTRHGLVYVNADAAVGGTRFGASGTPGMLGALRGVLERTSALDPAEGTLWDQWRQSSAQSSTAGEPRLGLPGSGSDFAVFLHHLSLPVLDIGFGGNSGGQYHTAIDDFAFVERFLDPGFAAHELAGRFAADLLAELATAPQGGFDAAEAARELARIVREAGAEGADAAGNAEPAWLGVERAEELARAFDDLAQAAEGARAAGATPGKFYARLACAGLPERPWFKNRLWAPGLESGYRSETLPTLRRAAAAAQGDPEELAAELSGLVLAAGELGLELAREGGRAGAGP